MNSAIIGGLIGVVGVFVGVFIERLVQRYGKLRFVADEVAIFVRGEEISERTESGLLFRAVYGIPIDSNLLEDVEWFEFRVRVQFFNEKEVRTGLRDVAFVFKSSSRRNPIQFATALTEIISYRAGEAPETRSLDVINLPSREWLSLELTGSLHDSTAQEQILAFSEIDQVEFRGYFPDGREFRRSLTVWTNYLSNVTLE